MTRVGDYVIETHLEVDGVEGPIECGWQDGRPVVPWHLLPPRIAYEGRLTRYIWRAGSLVDSCVGQHFIAAGHPTR